MIEEWFRTGRAVDAALLLTAAEAIALIAWRRPRVPVLANLAAGAFLMLALRLALAGAWWGWLAACLVGALAAHGLDLRARLRAGAS